MTQTPTQTTQKMDGNNGGNTSKDHLGPVPTALESGRNRCLETVRATTDQKAGGSNPSGRTSSSQAVYRLRRVFSFQDKTHRVLILLLLASNREPSEAGRGWRAAAARRSYPPLKNIDFNRPLQRERTSNRKSFLFGFRWPFSRLLYSEWKDAIIFPQF